jgi:hypothetical protein
MATLEQEERRLFEEALRAALASEEIQAGVGLTTITEGELRARADEAKEEIWRVVRRERQQFHDLSEEVAALERRLADRRGAAEPSDIVELRGLEERLRDLLNVFDRDPAYWESGDTLQVVRKLLLELSPLLRGELSEILQSYSEALSGLIESTDSAIDAVDIAIGLQRAEVEKQESEGSPNLDRLTQLRASVRGAAAQIRNLHMRLEDLLSFLSERQSR